MEILMGDKITSAYIIEFMRANSYNPFSSSLATLHKEQHWEAGKIIICKQWLPFMNDSSKIICNVI